MFVTISGTAASGKSTVARLLAQRLGYACISMGYIMRKAARKRGLTLSELNTLSEKDPSIDRELDEYQKNIGKTGKNLVIDGRMSFHFIPQSVKVYIDCDIKERARRIFEAQRPYESFSDAAEAEKKLSERERSDRHRYEKYYSINCFDTKHYDLVLRSDDRSPEQLVNAIIEFLKKK